ncbi:hypothetical protein CJ030_MR4G020922 [Morella rubra]|uniref:Uncharacterized protein n=1 Tax=Morella rubra TaxID=262757 RepID=A0A6A1VWT2_9ROSI|nr:hypothetical protein CJ030_MR4G020922 [Morella rubra]
MEAFFFQSPSSKFSQDSSSLDEFSRDELLFQHSQLPSNLMNDSADVMLPSDILAEGVQQTSETNYPGVVKEEEEASNAKDEPHKKEKSYRGVRIPPWGSTQWR